MTVLIAFVSIKSRWVDVSFKKHNIAG